MQLAARVIGAGYGSQDHGPPQPCGWQVIVVQVMGGCRPNARAKHLQTTIVYGDCKESTPLVQERQPLWNFWTQMPDRGGREKMVFSLLERDEVTGDMVVKGDVRLDLTQYRRCGKIFELWETLTPKAGTEGTVAPELHLTISYHISSDAIQEETDCRMCSTIDCVIS